MPARSLPLPRTSPPGRAACPRLLQEKHPDMARARPLRRGASARVGQAAAPSDFRVAGGGSESATRSGSGWLQRGTARCGSRRAPDSRSARARLRATSPASRLRHPVANRGSDSSARAARAGMAPRPDETRRRPRPWPSRSARRSLRHPGTRGIVDSLFSPHGFLPDLAASQVDPGARRKWALPAAQIRSRSVSTPETTVEPTSRTRRSDGAGREEKFMATETHQEAPAISVALAHVEAWSNHEYDTARAALAPDVR